MKLLHVVTRSDTVGGAGVYMAQVCGELARRGNHVIAGVGGNGPFVEVVRERGVEVLEIPHLARDVAFRSDYASYVELKRIVETHGIDIICTHSTKAGLLGRLVGHRTGIPTVVTVHGWSFSRGIPRFRRLICGIIEMLAAPLATHIVCVSRYDMRLAMSLGMHHLARITSIPNAVEDISVKRLDRVNSMRASCVVVGRLDSQKRQDEVLLAAALLEDLDFDLVFVGDGPTRHELEGLAEDLGLSARCEFLGSRDDVAELLAQNDVFILMSNYEGMPLSILEAMRAGLPVLASSAGGVEEAVEDGVTGYLVEPHDVLALSERMRILLTDPRRREAMGIAGREAFETKFSLDRLIDDLENLYATVCGV